VEARAKALLTAAKFSTAVGGCGCEKLSNPSLPPEETIRRKSHQSGGPRMFSLRVPEIGGFRDSKLEERPEKFSFWDGRG
jgi:hypothetical protein